MSRENAVLLDYSWYDDAYTIPLSDKRIDYPIYTYDSCIGFRVLFVFKGSIYD